MKHIVKIFAFAQALLLPGAALAADIPIPNTPALLGSGGQGLNFYVNIIVNGLLGIAGIIAVVVLIVGGFQYASAAGNEDQVENAKKTITYAIIGLVIVAAALLVVNTVLQLLPKTT